jgi:hypothetical protein
MTSPKVLFFLLFLYKTFINTPEMLERSWVDDNSNNIFINVTTNKHVTSSTPPMQLLL